MSILSIQSHVAYGYVGNKASTYPLQSMGYDVWPVHTVQFSNHTGYKIWQGDIFSKEHIAMVVKGLEDMGLVPKCRAILSGYMGSADICFEVLSIVQRFKKENKDLIYLCDPVIGNTSCYVKPEVLEFFKEHLNADIITPNQFEATVLSGVAIKDLKDAAAAADYFHGIGIKVVVITGLELDELPENELFSFVSDGKVNSQVRQRKYPFEIAPNGTGDLFSALFLGHFLHLHDAGLALQKAVHFTDLVMQKTFDCNSRELKIIDVAYNS